MTSGKEMSVNLICLVSYVRSFLISTLKRLLPLWPYEELAIFHKFVSSGSLPSSFSLVNRWVPMNIYLSAGPGIISQCGSKGLASCMSRPAPVCHGQNVTGSWGTCRMLDTTEDERKDQSEIFPIKTSKKDMQMKITQKKSWHTVRKMKC